MAQEIVIHSNKNPIKKDSLIESLFRKDISKSTAKPKTSSTKAPSYKQSDYSSYGVGGNSSAGGSGGGYGVRRPDISGLLNAYEQEAAANRATVNNSYETTRNDLLTSLKRFQEQNAIDKKNQQQNYLSEQAGLESARESANRQNRISAAARGIGGSGLQQLAQLQSQMAQGEEISQAANKNQASMEALIKALQNQEEDTNTKVANALKARDNALMGIESDLASKKAKAEYDAEQSYTSAYNSARAAAQANNVNVGLLVDNSLSDVVNQIKTISKDNKNYKGTAKKKEAVRDLIAKNNQNMNMLLENYGNTGWYDTYKKDINSALKAYGLGKYY